MSDIQDILNINSAAYDAGFKAGAEAMRERAAKKCEEYSATLSKADCPIGGILKPLWCANEIRALPVEE